MPTRSLLGRTYLHAHCGANFFFMLDSLLDIRQRLRTKEYHNEEHVRLALVARLVQELGWDI